MTLVGSSNEPPNRREDVVADAIGGIDAVLGDEVPDLDEVDFRFGMKREFVHPRATFLAPALQTLKYFVAADRLHLPTLDLVVAPIEGCVDSAEFLEVALDDLAQNRSVVAPCLPREFFDPRFVLRCEFNGHRWFLKSPYERPGRRRKATSPDRKL